MNLITISLIAALSATVGLGSQASAGLTSGDSIVAGDFLGPTASFAWAGEDETFSTVSFPEMVIRADEAVDVELMTPLAAPEPPAIVLAGMALGGLICGRSLLRRGPAGK